MHHKKIIPFQNEGILSAHANFNFQELSWYLSNTYICSDLKLIEEQDSGKILHQGYHLLPWQPHFQCHITQILTLLNIFLH